MAAMALTLKSPRNHCLLAMPLQNQNNTKNFAATMLNTRREVYLQKHITSSARLSRSVRAFSKSQREDAEKSSLLVSQEDLDYLVRLGGGSILGAAVIKYGSIVLPEITRPNLVQALVMISAPVLMAVLLLINQSQRRLID